jgi:hypothetical protein
MIDLLKDYSKRRCYSKEVGVSSKNFLELNYNVSR